MAKSGAGYADWTDYIVAAVREFVVWGSNPAGYVDRDKAEWLIGALSGGCTPETARAIARGAVEEALETDELLMAFAADSKRRAHEAVPLASGLPA